MKRLFKKITPTVFLWLFSSQLLAQINKPIVGDTSIYSYETVTIQGKKYYGFLNKDGFSLLDSQDDTIIKQPGDYFAWKLEDFNIDGYKDIFLVKGGNIPERFEILLFTPSTKSYKKVVDFNRFPDPKKINGTKYYYSYHKNGCADADWVSDLFYIKNYRAFSVAKIDGVGCGDTNTPNAIYIFKIRGNKKKLIKSLPIQTIEKYKENKWGFIEEYWRKNYTLFL